MAIGHSEKVRHVIRLAPCSNRKGGCVFRLPRCLVVTHYLLSVILDRAWPGLLLERSDP
jgi:hypothetical protein